MTNKEAIQILNMVEAQGSLIIKAKEKAIEALEHEPCEDCISRQAAIEKMSDYVVSGYADSAEDFEEYSNIIRQLPSVQPIKAKREWISVSARLPEDRRETYLVYTDSDYMQICRWTNINHFWQDLTMEWHWHWMDAPSYSKIVAWMPLPKPYKKGDEESDAE